MRNKHETKNLIDKRFTIINGSKSVDLNAIENLKDFRAQKNSESFSIVFREHSQVRKSYGSKFCDSIEECLIYLNENKLKYIDILNWPTAIAGKYCLIFERSDNE